MFCSVYQLQCRQCRHEFAGFRGDTAKFVSHRTRKNIYRMPLVAMPMAHQLNWPELGNQVTLNIHVDPNLIVFTCQIGNPFDNLLSNYDALAVSRSCIAICNTECFNWFSLVFMLFFIVCDYLATPQERRTKEYGSACVALLWQNKHLFLPLSTSLSTSKYQFFVNYYVRNTISDVKDTHETIQWNL